MLSAAIKSATHCTYDASQHVLPECVASVQTTLPPHSLTNPDISNKMQLGEGKETRLILKESETLGNKIHFRLYPLVLKDLSQSQQLTWKGKHFGSASVALISSVECYYNCGNVCLESLFMI
jgi:hypothetical protein